MIARIQEFIHQLEVGAGARWLRLGVGLLAVLVLAGLQLLRNYQNLSDPAAMDTAQVARQVARGQGFTTQLIRPLSVHVLEERAAARASEDSDPGGLRSPHPDLVHPPMYPLVLAAGFKLGPAHEPIPGGRAYRIYPPDRLVVMINYGLLVLWVGLVYALALRWFDSWIGVLAATAVAGSAAFWRLAASGQSTVLAGVWVLLAAHLLMAWDAAARSERWGGGRLAVGAAGLGILVGLAGLTQYALLALMLPVAILLFPGWLPGRRWSSWGAALLGMALVVTPWLARNQHYSGHWFGIAPAALVADSADYPGDSLERALERPLDRSVGNVGVGKAGARLSAVVQNDLPRLGGSWVAAFFLVGLLFRFSDPSREVLRLLVLLGMLVLIPVQAALGPGAAPGSEWKGTDYLAVLAPLVMILGTAFFASLLEHVDWPLEGVKPLVVGIFVLVAVLPVALSLLRSPPLPQTFPPYHPPFIQRLAEWTEPDELVMTDIPWAVAWYGDRPAVWLTRNAIDEDAREDFFAFNDYRRSLAGIYLTQLTTDAPFFSEMQQPGMLRSLRQEEDATAEEPAVAPVRRVGWPEFVYRSLSEQWSPPGFPLRYAHAGFAASGHLLLMDRRRWQSREEE